MASTKRKFLEIRLQRRVRARRDIIDESDHVSIGPASQIEETQEFNKLSEQNSEDKLERGREDFVDEAEPELISSISFGALAKVAKAQANLQRPPKRPVQTNLGENIVDVARKYDVWQDNEALERKVGRKDHRDFSRASKHAPVEISSKKAVSRKREVIPVVKREFRDPRFESLSGLLDSEKLQKAYAFLDEYQEDEMKELKSTIKKTKDETEKEGLKRTLLSMESRKRAQERKRKEAEILQKHRMEEKELVKQGKKPFYLKKTEQRKRLLVDRFRELKGKQLDRVLERRRKKIEGKEKKKIPWSRRRLDEPRQEEVSTFYSYFAGVEHH